MVFAEQFKLMISCLLAVRFMLGNLEVVEASLMFEFSISEPAGNDSERVREGNTVCTCYPIDHK